jgi:hypothetical protein
MYMDEDDIIIYVVILFKLPSGDMGIIGDYCSLTPMCNFHQNHLSYNLKCQYNVIQIHVLL